MVDWILNKKEYPKISVVTPSYNSGKYIECAIRSVLFQDYPHFEHIIVDGKSTDDTLSIIKNYPHLIWLSEEDKGQSDAMNKGFNMSSGQIIVYLNADDYFETGAFKAVLPYFMEGAMFVVGKVRVIRDNGSFWINDPEFEFFEMLKWWKKDAFCFNPVGYFYRREVQEVVGGFDLSNETIMDLDFLLKCARLYEFIKIDHILGTFRLIEGTKTSNCGVEDHYIKKIKLCDRHACFISKADYEEYARKKTMHMKSLKIRILFEKALRDSRWHSLKRNWHLWLFSVIKLILLSPAYIPLLLRRNK